MSRSTDWFSDRGGEHPTLASESPRALENLLNEVRPRIAALGLSGGGDGYWSAPLESGLHVCAHVDVYRAAVEVSVYYPRAGGGVGRRHDGAERRIVSVASGAWPENLARAFADATKEAKDLQPPICPLCDSAMVLRTASRGPHTGEDFHGCSQFPDCRGFRAPWGTSSKDRADDGDDAGFPCPECGEEMRIRYAKQGPSAGQRFYGCGGFPECDRVVDNEEEATALRLMGDSFEPEREKGPWEDLGAV